MNTKNVAGSLWIICAGVGVMLLTAAAPTDYSPQSVWYRTMIAAENASFAWAGYTYTGPFTNQTHQTAANVRTMSALEAMAAVSVSSVMANYGTNYTTNYLWTYVPAQITQGLTNYTTDYLYGYVSNSIATHHTTDTNWAVANFGSATVTNTLTTGGLLLSTPRWVDSQSPAASWINGGSALSWNTNYCGYVLQKGDIGYGSIQLGHDIQTGAITIYPHIHFTKTAFEGAGSANTNIVLSFAYRSAPIGDQFGAWQEYTITNGVNIFATNIGTHSIVGIPTAGLAVTGGISKVFSFRVSRVNKADDNYSAGDVVFTHVDIHYPVDSIGSSGPATK